MDHSLSVGKVNRVNDSNRKLSCCRTVKKFGLNPVRQIGSLHQGHGKPRLAVQWSGMIDNADVINGHNSRMIQPGSGGSFPSKSPLGLFRGKCASQQHLNRDGATQSWVTSFEDNTHPASINLLKQFILANFLQRDGNGRGRSSRLRNSCEKSPLESL